MQISNEQKIANRYEIVCQIGVGGMSYVYKAYDIKMKRNVAIKILKEENRQDEEFVAKFKREAESSAKLCHPNIIQAYDVIDNEDFYCIVMELVEGKTLKKYIQEKGKLSNDETVAFTLQIAKGLEEAHKKGIIHRDVKPQNIIINEKNIAKISDFGIARAVGQATTTTSAVGSIHYMSPEQAKTAEVDERSDIYSLGCSMYEMITGKIPFEGDSVSSIILAHLRGSIKNPSEDNPKIYKSLEKIILKMTQKDPLCRYQNVKDLINDLNKALKKKDGNYIEIVSEVDNEGTIRISDNDMQTIKSWSNNQDTKVKHHTSKSHERIEHLVKKYFSEEGHRNRIIIAFLASAIMLFVIIILAYNLYKTEHTKPTNIIISTVSEIIPVENTNNDKLVIDLTGLSINTALEISKPYDIKFNIISEDFSDEYEAGEIIYVSDKEFQKGALVTVEISKGPYVLDFSNLEWLNKLKIEQLEVMLNDRNLKYKIEEIEDNLIPKGYVISTNKNNSKEDGELVVYVSKGQGINKDYEESDETTASDDGNVSWYSNINTSCIVGVGKNPQDEKIADIVVGVRLKQIIGTEIHYTELTQARVYKGGTKIPVVYSNIKGEAGILNGMLEVVDVVSGEVLFSYPLEFKPLVEEEISSVITNFGEGKPGGDLTKG